MKQYHNDHSRVSRSGVMRLLKSPAHYQAYLNEPHKDTDAMRFGRVYDAFLLENKTPKVCPFDSFRTAEAREWRDTHTDYVRGDEMDVLNAMRDAMPEGIFVGGSAQVSVYWTDPVTGVDCKALPDYLRGSTCFDLKTTDDASPGAFARSVRKYGYDIQVAMYLDGCASMGVTEFIFVVQEKSAPYAVKLYRLSEETVELARMRYRDALQVYADCVERDEWPAYDTNVEIIEI